MSAFHFLPDEPQKTETCRKMALYGQKPPLKPREVWAIRTRLQIQGKRRDLALFNLAIDSKRRKQREGFRIVTDVLSSLCQPT